MSMHEKASLRKAVKTGHSSDTHIEQAAGWMARLMADDVCEQDKLNCQRWRDQHPEHEQAWQRMCQVSGKFTNLPQSGGLSSVIEKAHQAVTSRRRFLKTLALAGVGVSVTAFSLPHRSMGRVMLAQYRTGVGEIRTVQLEDGTRLTLNTDSAVDVTFSERQRSIRLHQGEILLKTGHETPRRHFEVQTKIGDVVALGTEFAVRQHNDHIHIAVLEGVVEAHPGISEKVQRVSAGQQSHFSRDRAAHPQPLLANPFNWQRGKLVAQGMRVADFVEELARYRPGFTLYDDAVADLTISGVFSLQDTDRALQSLAASLPVALSYRTDYWVKVVPAR
jgi:transmembrane sensor